MSDLFLNCGSGQRRFPKPWINIDKVSRPGMEPDLVCDGSHLPYEDASAKYFVLHHCLEHLWQMDAKVLIDEAYRVLKPGGSLLVFVPNMRALAIRWLEGLMDTQTYMTNVYGAYMGDEEDRHKWGYDNTSLSLFMVGERPWKAIEYFDWRPIPGANIAKDFWIIGMEAVR